MERLIGTLLFSLLVCSTFGLPYTKDSGVISLDKDSFAKEVFASEHVWLVEFYAPWCGHCKSLAPEYEKLAKNLKGIIKVAAVNGDEQRELAQAYDIKGFPTIKLFPSKIKQTSKGYSKDPIDYQGPRTAAAMSEFALGHLPNFVTTLTSKNMDNFLETETANAKVLLFTNKKEVTSLFKALAVDFHYSLNFGAIRDTEKALVEKYGVTKFPTLLLIAPEKPEEPVVYSGDLKHETLYKFLYNYAPEKIKDKEKDKKKEKEKEKESPIPKRNVREEVKDEATFESLCFDKAASCIIAFLDPENQAVEDHEKQLKVFEAVSNKNSDKFIFLWVNGVQQYDFADKLYMTSGFPSMMLIHHKKKAQAPYIGAFDETSIQEWLDRVLRGAIRPSPLNHLPQLSSPNTKKDEL